MSKKERYNIYVIELSKDVLSDRRFAEENADYKEGMPCVYVGMTARTPEERFAQHKAGIKAARLAKRYGLRLKPRQYASLNPMTYDEACKMEVEKARRLRKRGWGVWQR